MNLGKTIPRALAIGTLIVTAAYIAINTAYLAVLPLEKVASSNRVAADFAEAIIGPGTANALSLLVILSIMAASLYFLRQREDYRPAYRLRGYAVLCGVFVVSSTAIVIHHLVSQPRRGLIGLAIVLAGLPVYWIWTRRRVPAGAHA